MAVDAGPERRRRASSAAMEANFLWELRKYVLVVHSNMLLLLQATLAASVTYAAGLSPLGGIFYFNATAFATSVVTVNLLLVHSLSRRRWWLRALQAAMILDQLGLMGAYAAGSCREVAMSAYVLALVAMASAYVCAHVLFFALCALRRRGGGGGKSAGAPEPPEAVERARKDLLIFATLVAMVTYQAGQSTPGGFLSDSQVQDDDRRAGDPMLAGDLFLAFFYLNTTAFVASLVVIMLLMSRTVTRHGFRSCALWVCTGAAPFSRSVKTSIYMTALLAAVLLYIGLQVLVFWCKPVKNWLLHVQETLQRYLKLDHLPSSPEDHRVQVQTPSDLDADQLLKKSRMHLLLLGILTAGVSVTYQAGLNPPGGFWQTNAADGRHEPPGGFWPENKTGHVVGNPVLSDNFPRRYLASFYRNATAFVALLAIIMMLVDRKLSTRGIQSYALRVCVVLDLIRLMGAYAAGNSRKVSTSIYVLALVFAVLLCIALQLALVVSQLVQALLQKVLSLFGIMEEEEEDDDADVLPSTTADAEAARGRDPWYEKLPKYLLLLAALAAALSYQAAMNPPGGLCGDGESGHVAGHPVLWSTYPKRYKAFFYCNATSFIMASLVIMVLLLIKRVSRAQAAILALHAAMILNLFGLMGAYAAGSSRRVRTCAYIQALVVGVSVYIVVLVFVSRRVMCGIESD
ncbi:hypothetical protein PVAP13_1NG488138 [Panicum virgatum]|uniref:PGG domain-containing protein n=1 Tax=Panicum virgatum TaxID=38727 RepID=A0A8T0X8R2_PANVG|nr:hypothetical protein PVAP13_1NG488138 [Panicum virgatum]